MIGVIIVGVITVLLLFVRVLQLARPQWEPFSNQFYCGKGALSVSLAKLSFSKGRSSLLIWTWIVIIVVAFIIVGIDVITRLFSSNIFQKNTKIHLD